MGATNKELQRTPIENQGTSKNFPFNELPLEKSRNFKKLLIEKLRNCPLKGKKNFKRLLIQRTS